MFYNYLIIFIVWGITSYLISLALNYYLIHNNSGFTLKKTNTNAVRFASQSKPIYGGITFYALFMLYTLAYLFLLDKNFYVNEQTFGLGLAVTLAFFMGLVDDLLSTPPVFKFIMQVIIALLLINFNIYIQIFDNNIYNYALTMLWVVGIMNSINMLDNMDAITASITLTILAGMFINIIITNDYTKLPYLLGIVVVFFAILGFLKYNWAPSKIYMGDNGSQFLGALLGGMSIMFLWNTSGVTNQPALAQILKPFIIVLLAFIVPIIDTTTVSINRLLRGQSPFVGGKDHTTHHLFYLGLKNKQVALLLISISLFSVLLSVLIVNNVKNWTETYTVIFISYFILIFGALYINTRVNKEKLKKALGVKLKSNE